MNIYTMYAVCIIMWTLTLVSVLQAEDKNGRWYAIGRAAVFGLMAVVSSYTLYAK